MESGVDVTSIQIPNNLISCMADIDPVVAVIFAITSTSPASPLKDTIALPDASVVAVGVMFPMDVVKSTIMLAAGSLELFKTVAVIWMVEEPSR